MRRLNSMLLVTVLALGLAPLQAQAWNRDRVSTLLTLPAGAQNRPEGIAVDRSGNLYVSTFAFDKPETASGQIFVFGSSQKLSRVLEVERSSRLLLGVALHPHTGKLLVADFGSAQVLEVDPNTGASTVFMSLPSGVTGAGLNAITFDAAGNVYVSDSFNGTIWQTAAAGGTASAWVAHDNLRTTGVPGFGANGLAFNKSGDTLFVANTGNDTVVKVAVAPGADGQRTAEVFVNGINGADGLAVDGDDNIWVAANQANELVVLNPSGRVIAKLGDFNGIDSNGTVNGYLFPASLVFHGGKAIVTNLALDLRSIGAVQSVDSQWAAQVRVHSITQIDARIPPIQGLK
jgi:sugar lactone lactonase YvrE